MSLDLLVGYCRLYSFGHAAAYGLGAYATALILTHLALPLPIALYAGFAGFASPELFFWLVSGRVLIMVVVGGAGTLIGPVIGGVFFVFLEHELSQVTDLWPLIFGSVFIAFVMFAPEGIWGILTKSLQLQARGPELG